MVVAEVDAMFSTVKGHFDGKNLVLDEPAPLDQPAEVLVTFISPSGDHRASRALLDTILARGPISIAPLQIKELIEEGRR